MALTLAVSLWLPLDSLPGRRWDGLAQQSSLAAGELGAGLVAVLVSPGSAGVSCPPTGSSCVPAACRVLGNGPETPQGESFQHHTKGERVRNNQLGVAQGRSTGGCSRARGVLRLRREQGRDGDGGQRWLGAGKYGRKGARASRRQTPSPPMLPCRGAGPLLAHGFGAAVPGGVFGSELLVLPAQGVPTSVPGSG